MCVISAPGKLRQEGCHKLEASLDYRAGLVSKMPSKIKPSSHKPLVESRGDKRVTGLLRSSSAVEATPALSLEEARQPAPIGRSMHEDEPLPRIWKSRDYQSTTKAAPPLHPALLSLNNK